LPTDRAIGLARLAVACRLEASIIVDADQRERLLTLAAELEATAAQHENGSNGVPAIE
jgi:hypothetical protein